MNACILVGECFWRNEVDSDEGLKRWTEGRVVGSN